MYSDGKLSGVDALPKRSQWFDSFARGAASFCGKPVVFLLAVAIVLFWALTGPAFQYSDTWQLVINTGTTIVTFLMVFLIQNTQNRDTMAVQVKLAELIIAMKGAQNRIASAEDMSEEELDGLREEYQAKAKSTEHALASVRKRKGHR
jgi:low affinity Fe/Cu permease